MNTEYRIGALLKDENHSFWKGFSLRSQRFVQSVTKSKALLSVSVRPPREDDAVDTAWFIPSLNSITVNAGFAFQDSRMIPKNLDPSIRGHRLSYPLFMGVLVHEAGHSMFSKADHQERIEADLAPLEERMFTVFEEIRMEHRMALYRHDLMASIKHAVPHLVFSGFFSPNSIEARNKMTQDELELAFLSAYVLSYGRALSTYYSESFMIEDFRNEMKKIYGDKMPQMDQVLSKLHKVGDDDTAGMVKVVQEFLALFNYDRDKEISEEMEAIQSMFDSSCDEDADEGDEEGQKANGKPKPGDSAGKPSKGKAKGNPVPMRNLPPRIREQIKKMQEKMKEKDAAGDKNIEGEKERTLNDVQGDAIKAARKMVENNNVFNSSGCGIDTDSSWEGKISTREPMLHERDMAEELERQIKKAQFRDYHSDRVRMDTPPGRFNVRSAMRMDIERGMNLERKAKPWEINRYRDVKNPPLYVSVLGDISGSMDDYIPHLSGFMWCLNQALRRNEGKVCNVFWDDNVWRASDDDFKPRDLTVPLNTKGGSGGLPYAMQVSNGMLNLYREEGVKFQIVLTDSYLTNYSEIWEKLKYQSEQDIHTIWVSTADKKQVVESVAHPNVKEVLDSVNFIYLPRPEEFADVVAPIIVDALNAANRF